MAEIESVTFNKGINTKKSSVYLEDGELVSATGVQMETEGILEARGELTTVNNSYIGSIHSIHRMKNIV